MRDRKLDTQEQLPLMLLGLSLITFGVCGRMWMGVYHIVDALSQPISDRRLLGHVWWQHDRFALECIGASLLSMVFFAMLSRVVVRLWRYQTRSRRGQCAACGYPRSPDVLSQCPECGFTGERVAAMQRRDGALCRVLISVTIWSLVFSGLAKALPGTFEMTSIHGRILGAEFRQNDPTSSRRIAVVQVATWEAGWFAGLPRLQSGPALLRVAVEAAGRPGDSDVTVVRIDDAGRVVADDVAQLESLWRRNGAVLLADYQRLTSLVETEGFMVADSMRRYQGMSFSASNFAPNGATSIRGVVALLGLAAACAAMVWFELRKVDRLEAVRTASVRSADVP